MRMNVFKKHYLWLLACLLLLATSTGFAAKDARTERVSFKKGTNSAVIESSIKGYAIVDYVVGANAGQYMNVSLATRHGATYFNILAPGENEVAMFNGSVNQNQYEGALPSTGDYKIRVYMMRSAARRNEVAKYRLEVIVDDAGQPGNQQSAHDVKVPGTGFHATGKIPCATTKEQPKGFCDFGVKREGNGAGLVTITQTDGRQRVIFFEKGRAIGYDQSQADSGAFKATKEADMNVIHIGEERYEIPDAIILGD